MSPTVTVEVLERTVRIVPEAFQAPPPTRSAAITPANLREVATPRPPAGSSQLGFPTNQAARNFGRAASSATGRIYQTAPHVAGQVARVGWGVAKGVGKGVAIGIINDAALGVADAFADDFISNFGADVDSRSRNFEKPFYDPSARPNNAPYNWGYERGREVAAERSAARQELQESMQEQWDVTSTTARDVAQDLIDRGKDWAREIPWPEISWPEINFPPINFPEINWPDGQLIDKPEPIQWPNPNTPSPDPSPDPSPEPFNPIEDLPDGQVDPDIAIDLLDPESVPKPPEAEADDGPGFAPEEPGQEPILACDGWAFVEYGLASKSISLMRTRSGEMFKSSIIRDVKHYKRWVFRPYNFPVIERGRREDDRERIYSYQFIKRRVLRASAVDCGFGQFEVDVINGGWSEEQWAQHYQAFPYPRPCGNSDSSIILPGYQLPGVLDSEGKRYTPISDTRVEVLNGYNGAQFYYSYWVDKDPFNKEPWSAISRFDVGNGWIAYFRITCHTSGGGNYWGPSRIEPQIKGNKKMGCSCNSIRAMLLSLRRTLKIPVISCELNEETNLWEAKSEEKEIEIFTLDAATAAGMGELYKQQAEIAIAQCEGKNGAAADINAALGFPVTVPKLLNEGEDEEEEVTNLVELYKNWIGIFDGLMGEFPVKMQIITDEGQEHEIELLSVADALGDLTALAIPTFYDADNVYTLQIKCLIEQAKSFSLLNQAFHLLFSISEQLGFNIEKIPSILELPFNPNYPDDWEQFNKNWIPEEPNSYIYQNTDKQTLKGILIDLGELLAPVHGSVAERASPMAIAEKARKLAEILRVGRELGLGEVLADVLNQNWDGVLTKLSQQATATTPEIKVRKKNEPNQ